MEAPRVGVGIKLAIEVCHQAEPQSKTKPIKVSGGSKNTGKHGNKSAEMKAPCAMLRHSIIALGWNEIKSKQNIRVNAEIGEGSSSGFKWMIREPQGSGSTGNLQMGGYTLSGRCPR